MEWFNRSSNLNRWDSRPCAGYGWCLDWLDQQAESGPYFSRAEELDPNNYYNLNNIGLHYVQLGDYAAAKPWFQPGRRKSLRPDGRGQESGRSTVAADVRGHPVRCVDGHPVRVIEIG